MKDRIEVVSATNKNGKPVLKFYVHCDLGVLYLFEKKDTPPVRKYFGASKSMDELRSYRFTMKRGDEVLNKIVERLPLYVKYAKEEALCGA